MSICERYTRNKEEAMEIYNDSFLKVFREVYRYKPAYENEENSFKGWVRKIIIYTAIDYVRKYHKQSFVDISGSSLFLQGNEEDALDIISHDEIINAIRGLSPAYRTVLNMFIVDGFTHEEIANQLGISIGASKSNLFKARQQLKKILKKDNTIQIVQNVG